MSYENELIGYGVTESKSPSYEYRRTDLATGQTKRWIGRPGDSKSTSKEPFVMVVQSAAANDVAMNYALKGFDLRVLWMLVGILDQENWIEIHQARLAKQMSTSEHQIKPSQVSRSVGHLVEHGLLLKGEFRTYRLSPSFGWKGSVTSQASARKAHRKGALELVR